MILVTTPEMKKEAFCKHPKSSTRLKSSRTSKVEQ